MIDSRISTGSKTLKENSKGFTLIELMVVIAIVGLLGSIIIVSARGLKGEASVAKTLQFSQSLYNSLGAYAVGVWSFDEGSGTVAIDGSGYGNNGSIAAGVSYTDDDVYEEIRRGDGRFAIYLDGSASVSVPINSSWVNAIQGTFTAEAWFRAPDTSNVWGGIIYVPSFKFLILPRYSNNSILVQIGAAYYTLTSADMGTTLSADTWYHYAATFDCPTKTLKHFLNGELRQTNTTANCAGIVGGNMTFGDYGGSGFNGTIDEVRLYEATLIASEIQKHYAEGLKSHPNLALK